MFNQTMAYNNNVAATLKNQDFNLVNKNYGIFILIITTQWLELVRLKKIWLEERKKQHIGNYHKTYNLEANVHK